MAEPLIPNGVGMQNAITLLQSIANTLGTINTTLNAVFPQATGTATSAATGSVALPTGAAGYLQVYSPSLGTTVKIPYYT